MLDRREKKRRGWQGEKHGESWMNQESMGNNFLIFPIFINKCSKEEERGELPRPCPHKTQIQVTGIIYINNKR